MRKSIILAKCKRKIRNILCRCYLMQTFNKDRLVLLCPFGIGDSLFIRFFIEELKMEVKRNIYIICREYCKEVFDSCNAVEAVYSNTRMCNWLRLYCTEKGYFRSEGFIYCHFKNFNDADMCKYESIIECYHTDILQLKGKMHIHRPQIKIDKEMELEIIDKYSINDKTIIISPYANSKYEAHTQFWDKLVRELISLGYSVLTNGNGEKEPALEGTGLFSASLKETFICVQKCRCFIGYRSGLCDWLACADCRMIVLNDPKWNSCWNVNYFSANQVPVIPFGEDGEDVAFDEIISILNR